LIYYTDKAYREFLDENIYVVPATGNIYKPSGLERIKFKKKLKLLEK